MDLIYALYRKHNTSTKIHSEFESLHDGETLCSVSSQNIVAFTTRTELDDVSAKTWGSHVYVADLNTPWFSHKVISSQAVVTALEWDLPGHKLLVADASGVVSLWTLKDYVLNDWVCLGTINFAGEHIIGAAFFHNGKKIVIVPEKKDNYLYSEKFTHVRFAPSVRQFGGRSVEGCLVISTTGMVGALAVSKDGSSHSLITTTESLGSTRHRITAVDICYGKNGQYLVAVSSGSVSMPIQCFKVSVKRIDDKLSISSQALPSFFMLAGSSAENIYDTVTQLKFVVREDADTLVVAANSDSGALIEIWELQEKSSTIHKLFQSKVQSAEPFRNVLWQHQSQYSLSYPITCMTTLKMALTNTVPPPLYVIVVLTDGSIHCLSRDTLKQVATAYMAVGWRDDVKHQKLSIDISSIDLTWLGGALVVADAQGQLYMYRLHPIGESGATMSASYAASLLEYCLVTGLDWWDVLIALRPPLLDAVCDRLTEGFSRQPTATQQFHYVSHLSLRAALCRLSPAGQARAADLTALLMLHSVSTAFKTLLRPSDLSSHDKGPADSLQAVMDEAVMDIDSVLLHLEAKEFTVEPSTLQSLHQLIQWVADLALNLLARLPEQRKTVGREDEVLPTIMIDNAFIENADSAKFLGMHLDRGMTWEDHFIKTCTKYELVRDSKAMNSIRELLIIIRFWGLLRNSCLPVFIRSAENLDVLALLFKLLSRLVQNPEPDEVLLDDCVLLPNQVMIPPLNTATPNTAITSPALFYMSPPLKLEFGVEPDCLLFVPDLNPVEGAMATDQIVDTIRHIYLGHQPLVVKQCCRCGGKAQVQSCPRTAAIRAWDLRWARACRCGGHWRIQKYT